MGGVNIIKIYGNKDKDFYIQESDNVLNVEPFKTRSKAEQFFELHYGMTYKEYKKNYIKYKEE